MAEKGNMGFQAGIGQQSKVQRLAWALKGAPARTKDLRLNAIAGVAEGRKLRDRVTTLLKNANPEANPEDAMVFCVFAEPDLSAEITEMLSVKNGASDLAIAAKFVDKLPVGFLVFVFDREDPERPIFGHARPLIVEDPRGIALNEQALNRLNNRIKRRLGVDDSN